MAERKRVVDVAVLFSRFRGTVSSSFVERGKAVGKRLTREASAGVFYWAFFIRGW